MPSYLGKFARATLKARARTASSPFCALFCWPFFIKIHDLIEIYEKLEALYEIVLY